MKAFMKGIFWTIVVIGCLFGFGSCAVYFQSISRITHENIEELYELSDKHPELRRDIKIARESGGYISELEFQQLKSKASNLKYDKRMDELISKPIPWEPETVEEETDYSPLEREKWDLEK